MKHMLSTTMFWMETGKGGLLMIPALIKLTNLVFIKSQKVITRYVMYDII